VESYEVTQAPFHGVAVYGGVLVPRDHETHPRKRVKGSGGAHV